MDMYMYTIEPCGSVKLHSFAVQISDLVRIFHYVYTFSVRDKW